MITILEALIISLTTIIVYAIAKAAYETWISK